MVFCRIPSTPQLLLISVVVSAVLLFVVVSHNDETTMAFFEIQVNDHESRYAARIDKFLKETKQKDDTGGPKVIIKSAVVDLAELEERKQIPNWKSCPRWYELATAVRRCITYAIKETTAKELWSKIENISEKCGSHLLKTVLRAKYLVNKDDVKAVVLPQNEADASTAVTLGVGNDVYAELRLRTLVKRTRFFGVDPIEESGAIYRTIGQYYQLAISESPGVANLSVMVNNTYVWRQIPTITLVQLLEEKLPLNGEPVDYLFMDIEGVEYKLLPKMVENEFNYTVCQISVELHGPLDAYGTDAVGFHQIVLQLLQQSRFLPLWIPKPTNHHRFFLIDYKSSYCVEKFYRYWC